MERIIHIFGASGSGTSTLGRSVSERTGCRFMDADDYFWAPSEPRFTQKRAPEERVRLMLKDMDTGRGAVISGSVADWGNALIPYFTLAVRLIADTEERLRRIRAREYERFGARILPGGDMFGQHQAFLQWAAAYDGGGPGMRSRQSHDEWQKQLRCPLLVLSGLDPVSYNTEQIAAALEKTRPDGGHE